MMEDTHIDYEGKRVLLGRSGRFWYLTEALTDQKLVDGRWVSTVSWIHSKINDVWPSREDALDYLRQITGKQPTIEELEYLEVEGW